MWCWSLSNDISLAAVMLLTAFQPGLLHLVAKQWQKVGRQHRNWQHYRNIFPYYAIHQRLAIFQCYCIWCQYKIQTRDLNAPQVIVIRYLCGGAIVFYHQMVIYQETSLLGHMLFDKLRCTACCCCLQYPGGRFQRKLVAACKNGSCQEHPAVTVVNQN